MADSTSSQDKRKRAKKDAPAALNVASIAVATQAAAVSAEHGSTSFTATALPTASNTAGSSFVAALAPVQQAQAQVQGLSTGAAPPQVNRNGFYPPPVKCEPPNIDRDDPKIKLYDILQRSPELDHNWPELLTLVGGEIKYGDVLVAVWHHVNDISYSQMAELLPYYVKCRNNKISQQGLSKRWINPVHGWNVIQQALPDVAQRLVDIKEHKRGPRYVPPPKNQPIAVQGNSNAKVAKAPRKKAAKNKDGDKQDDPSQKDQARAASKKDAGTVEQEEPETSSSSDRQPETVEADVEKVRSQFTYQLELKSNDPVAVASKSPKKRKANTEGSSDVRPQKRRKPSNPETDVIQPRLGFWEDEPEDEDFLERCRQLHKGHCERRSRKRELLPLIKKIRGYEMQDKLRDLRMHSVEDQVFILGRIRTLSLQEAKDISQHLTMQEKTEIHKQAKEFADLEAEYKRRKKEAEEAKARGEVFGRKINQSKLPTRTRGQGKNT